MNEEYLYWWLQTNSTYHPDYLYWDKQYVILCGGKPHTLHKRPDWSQFPEIFAVGWWLETYHSSLSYGGDIEVDPRILTAANDLGIRFRNIEYLTP